MTVNVLVVDDSLFFRHRLKEILNADGQIEVVAAVSNGAEAVTAAERLHPDVITMDIEMPVMDGISAVREIMRRCPTPILMFSSMTTAGAQATLEALDAGALDFMPKRIGELTHDQESFNSDLRARVRSLAKKKRRAPPGAVVAPKDFRLDDYQALLIGASTGGPAALQALLTPLAEGFPLPILLIQHMPASFTPPFAQRLDGLCRIRVRHAAEGDVLRPGTALLAPGGRQMVIGAGHEGWVVHITDGAADQTYRPSVDVTFASAAEAFPGRVLALVLTGMGHDGREGARLLKQKGATIWVQDESSCVVSGMPMSVREAGLADAVLPLGEIAALLARGG